MDERERNKEKMKEMKGCQSYEERDGRGAKEKRDAIAERGRKLERKKKTET